MNTGARVRRGLPLVLTLIGLVLYNWWVLVPLRPGLLKSPNELFSNLEIAGQPYATQMHYADTASGLLLLISLFLIGWNGIPGARREWVGLVVFTGALFAYPLLGFAYLTDHFGALIEPVFFGGFTAVVLILIFERVQIAIGARTLHLHSVGQFER